MEILKRQVRDREIIHRVRNVFRSIVMNARWMTRLEGVLRQLDDRRLKRSHTTQHPERGDPLHVSIPKVTNVIRRAWARLWRRRQKVNAVIPCLLRMTTWDSLHIQKFAKLLRKLQERMVWVPDLRPLSQDTHISMRNSRVNWHSWCARNVLCSFPRVGDRCMETASEEAERVRVGLRTGYATNMSVLGVLSETEPVSIFSDARNHASIIDGARLAARNGATVHIYRSLT